MFSRFIPHFNKSFKPFGNTSIASGEFAAVGINIALISEMGLYNISINAFSILFVSNPQDVSITFILQPPKFQLYF